MIEQKNTLWVYGKITEIHNAEHGETWEKRSFVIETIDKYPVTIHFNVWNKNIIYIDRCKVGDQAKVYFNISSREYKGNWYTEASVWRIEPDFLSIKNNQNG